MARSPLPLATRRRTGALLIVAVAAAVAAGCGSDGGGTLDTVSDTPHGTSDATPSSSTAPSTSAPGPSASTTAATASTAVPTTSAATTFVATSLVPSTTAPSGGFTLDPSTRLVRDAVADLADRLGIDPSEVAVVDAQAVTWGDTSLGCPQPGMNYLQRLVDGALVVLAAEGRTFEYHGGSPLQLCEHPKRPVG